MQCRILVFGVGPAVALWSTEDFKERYRQHRGGVEGYLSSLVRGQDIRVNRYIGQVPASFKLFQ